MPTADEHRAQAEENRAFYGEIGGCDAERSDWALTILFYSAVHEIQALFADNPGTIIGYGLHSPVKGHDKRLKALRAHQPWNRLERYYGQLYGWSRDTRYECHKPDEARLRKCESVLQRIREEIAGL